LKISGYYQLPWELGVGAFVRYQQGYPYVISGAVIDGSAFPDPGSSFETGSKV
jgi:hypothetical protein